MVEADAEHHAAIVASEPLTEEASWRLVPPNHMVLVDPDQSVDLRPIG